MIPSFCLNSFCFLGLLFSLLIELALKTPINRKAEEGHSCVESDPLPVVAELVLYRCAFAVVRKTVAESVAHEENADHGQEEEVVDHVHVEVHEAFLKVAEKLHGTHGLVDASLAVDDGFHFFGLAVLVSELRGHFLVEKDIAKLEAV